jgi:hypothetical protein
MKDKIAIIGMPHTRSIETITEMLKTSKDTVLFITDDADKSNLKSISDIMKPEPIPIHNYYSNLPTVSAKPRKRGSNFSPKKKKRK